MELDFNKKSIDEIKSSLNEIKEECNVEIEKVLKADPLLRDMTIRIYSNMDEYIDFALFYYDFASSNKYLLEPGPGWDVSCTIPFNFIVERAYNNLKKYKSQIVRYNPEKVEETFYKTEYFEPNVEKILSLDSSALSNELLSMRSSILDAIEKAFKNIDNVEREAPFTLDYYILDDFRGYINSLSYEELFNFIEYAYVLNEHLDTYKYDREDYYNQVFEEFKKRIIIFFRRFINLTSEINLYIENMPEELKNYMLDRAYRFNLYLKEDQDKSLYQCISTKPKPEKTSNEQFIEYVNALVAEQTRKSGALVRAVRNAFHSIAGNNIMENNITEDFDIDEDSIEK